jgi:exoribonuclease-2
MGDPTGHLVEFIDKNRMVLALVQNVNKSKLQVLTFLDKQVALNQNRALLITPASVPPDRPRESQVEYMKEVEARRELLAAEVDVPQLWELVQDEQDEVPLSDLAELVFGSDDADNLSAILRALFNERLHFKLAGNKYQPLSTVQLEQKQLQMEKEAQNRAYVDSAVDYLKTLPHTGPINGGPSPPNGLLKLLKDLVIFEEDAPGVKKAKEIASLAELGGRKKLFDLLVRLGEFSPNENLALLREGLPSEFSSQVMGEALHLDPAKREYNRRQDLTGVYTFTIDGAFTTDFDDALSFDPEPGGGGTIGVHITDAASLIEPESLLDLEARERGSTLYMPDARVPMLPPPLSEDALSLKQDTVRPAISLLARIDPEGQVQAFDLLLSVVRVDRRLSYEEADELLDSDPSLSGLYQACLAMKRRRGRDGAYFLPLPEVLVGVDEENQVWVRRVDRDGPTREMVAETAILANQLKAQFMVDNQTPALYRTQAPPKEPIEEGDPSDLYLHFRQRRLLNRVELTHKPGLHSSLGVKPYTHATSPIRRYLDLLMQRQLGAVLAGDHPHYTKEELTDLAMLVEPTVRRLNRVRQYRQRYWLMKWLEARKAAGETVAGIVMEYQVRRWQILISDIMMLTNLPNQPGLNLEPGMQVDLNLEKVDVFHDILKVSLT